ncbi:hypothetical protein [Xanthomonas citri]|uniref:hypothetical protein n=1 Tax=Xanthomonas citri TaxID=346 RepID=UPI0021CE9F16|nr:hypothetical protein [Xanthomonas citri]
MTTVDPEVVPDHGKGFFKVGELTLDLIGDRRVVSQCSVMDFWLIERTLIHRHLAIMALDDDVLDHRFLARSVVELWPIDQ